jgi:hypothetical protein
LLRLFWAIRGLRISWLIVGIPCPLSQGRDCGRFYPSVEHCVASPCHRQRSTQNETAPQARRSLGAAHAEDHDELAIVPQS